MDNTLKNTWQTVLQRIKPEVTSVSFNTWFKDLAPLLFKDNILYLQCENDFNKDVITSRYLPLLVNAVYDVLQQKCDVKIVLSLGEIESSAFRQTDDEDSLYLDRSPMLPVTNMNPKYTFEKFVIGENNRFAHAACVAVAESPSERYNPLFIYGGVGLGKTHLMQAIGNHVLSTAPDKKVKYVSCETFTNEFINAIQKKNNLDFRNTYRNVDILLIDDIQFLAGKDGTQEEFFHTFNALHQENKQIVISSDRPPKEIQNLAERLRSRFEMGLMTDISAPNFETRIAILRKKAETYNDNIPNDVLSYIADSIHSNIRELEGALTTIDAYSKLHKAEINMEMAKAALKDILKEKENIIINSSYIKEMTAKYFNISIEEMDSKKRTKAISRPRQVAMYITRELTEDSLPKIGEDFGGRDHSTVIHACQKIIEEMEKNIDFSNLVHHIQDDITKKR